MTPRGVCRECGALLVSTNQWCRRSTPEQRREWQAQGHACKQAEGICRPCHDRAQRRALRVELGDQRGRRRDEVLADWEWLADPHLSIAENCRRLAPRMGMRWRSLERAITRARAETRAA